MGIDRAGTPGILDADGSVIFDGSDGSTTPDGEAKKMTRRRIPEMLVLLAAMSGAACSRNEPPDNDPVIVTDSRDGEVGEADAAAADAAEGPDADGRKGRAAAGDAETRSTAARFNIPPGHLPPPGQCRVWMPGEPPGQQKKKYPVGRCSELRMSIPAGAWLVYRPTDDKKEVRVWEYGRDQEVLSQRIYSAVTGELIRHVAPGGS
ncbi:MAG: hypothetical protein ACR2GQ_03145 [Gemmatimonadota bacterium]